MQIHVLIPVPPPSFTGPDPPVVYHYTTGTRLRSIINSGAIKPTTAKIEPHEKPVAWFSTQGQWEWRFMPEAVPVGLFREVEFDDFANTTWLAGDLPERACRN